ncbi:MAG: ABC transporter ATP-binding protein [Actinomycetia bacterium]|nr:ABC transporter ATP-binding protein [Actinomycetes bacterium]
MTSPVLTASSVSKWFGSVVAVSDVSFDLGAGVTALLGPNGAGKSTLLRILAGLTAPSSGEVKIFGVDPRQSPAVRRRMGLVPQQDGLFERLSARDFVTVAASTHGLVDPSVAAARALAVVNLDPDDPRACRTYSKGMRQRVKIAQAIVHDPDVLLLDEPLTGLDPVQRRGLIDVFRHLGESGKCVIVSSHVLDEVAKIGSSVLVITQGRLAATGDYRRLREMMDDRPHRIRVDCQDARRLAPSLVGLASTTSVTLEGADRLLVDTVDIDTFGRSIAPLAIEAGVHLDAIEPLDDDLESVFRYLVQR